MSRARAEVKEKITPSRTRQLLSTVVLQTGDMEPLLHAGLNVEHFPAPADRDIFEVLLKSHLSHGAIPTEKVLRMDFPEYKFEAVDDEMSILIERVANARMGSLFAEMLNMSAEAYNTGNFDAAWDITSEGLERAQALTVSADNLLSDAPAHAEDVEWLVPGFARKATPVLWSGRSGSGKSTVLSRMVANLTVGWRKCPPIDVMYLQTEEDPATMRMRIEACGGDLTRVHTERDINGPVMPDFTSRQARAAYISKLKRLGVTLLVIDTLDQVLPGVNANSDTEVSQVLRAMAGEFTAAGIAVWGQRHSKQGDANGTTSKVNGAEAWVSSFRGLITIGMNDEEGYDNESVMTVSRAGAKQGLSCVIKSVRHERKTEGINGIIDAPWFTCDIGEDTLKQADTVEMERAAAYRSRVKGDAAPKANQMAWLEGFLAKPRSTKEVVAEMYNRTGEQVPARTVQRRLNDMAGATYNTGSHRWVYEVQF